MQRRRYPRVYKGAAFKNMKSRKNFLSEMTIDNNTKDSRIALHFSLQQNFKNNVKDVVKFQ